ncbi:MAG: hypothetical protein AB1798_21125, partial [Spirochaetota bacterium]
MILLKTFHTQKPDRGFPGLVRSGEIVTVHVIKPIPPGSYRISLKGRSLTVQSNVILKEGDQLKTKALWTKSRLALKVLETARNPDNFPPSMGLPNDSLSQQIVDILQRMGLTLNPILIQALRSQLQKIEKPDLFITRLLALLYDKHLQIPDELLSDFIVYASDNYGSSPNRQPDRGSPHTGHEDEDNESLKEAIKEKVKTAFTGISPVLDTPLALFNHFTAYHDNWIIIPFCLTVESTKLTGSIRLKTDLQSHAITNINVLIKSDELRWSFLLSDMHKKNHSLQILCNSGKGRLIAKQLIPGLTKKLGNFRIKVDDTISNETNFDGFTRA